MLAYRAGDAAAFETLFQRYQRRIYNYFLRHLGDWTVAEDLFQKTFLRLHEARGRYQPTAAFATWLYTIATNLLRDELARRGSSPKLEPVAEDVPAEPVHGAAGGSPERRVAAAEVRDRIRAAVRRLPAEQREAFILGKYEGRPSREIAAILGCTEGAARVRIHRAIKTLRMSLGALAHEV